MRPAYRARLDAALRRVPLARRLGVPLFQRVVLELQSHCNRDCFFCSRESDTSGKRKHADGTSVQRSMPTEKVSAILDELEALGFIGFITFHHLSEAFLDKRLLDVARDAKRRGMRPYVHTNGDVLRNSPQLCRAAAEVFEYIVVGLYDYQCEAEKLAEQAFWRERLQGTSVGFSLVENVYHRTHTPGGERMDTIVRHTHPTAVCAEPLSFLLIHYNGDVGCCCEDMLGELLRVNVFEHGIREIWYSDRHIAVIDDLQRGERDKYDLCSRCTKGANRYRPDPLLGGRAWVR